MGDLIRVGDERVVMEEFCHDDIYFVVGTEFRIVAENDYEYGCYFKERSGGMHSLEGLCADCHGWWIDRYLVEDCTHPKIEEPEWEI